CGEEEVQAVADSRRGRHRAQHGDRQERRPLARRERRRQDLTRESDQQPQHAVTRSAGTTKPRRREGRTKTLCTRGSSCVLRAFASSWSRYGCRLNVFAPGWVPEMNASRIEPGVSAGWMAPFALSTARNTILPGASKSGGSSLSGRPSM